MDFKQMKKTAKKLFAQYAKTDTICAFVIVVLFCVGALVNMFSEPKLMSEKENRGLAQFPQTSVQSIFNGSFMREFETYSADQFAWRDIAVSIKANCERLLGKKGNNGVHFADNGYLIARPEAFNADNVVNNTNALKTLQEMGGYNITVCTIPTAFEILQDSLPFLAYDDRVTKIQQGVVNTLMGTSINVCDVNSVLAEHKDEYIYYRTDHHQTALGSYYVYAALGPYLGYVHIGFTYLIKKCFQKTFTEHHGQRQAFRLQSPMLLNSIHWALISLR